MTVSFFFFLFLCLTSAMPPARTQYLLDSDRFCGSTGLAIAIEWNIASTTKAGRPRTLRDAAHGW
ncbi:MAG: hypothetical protein JWM76_3079, partial [Pseudonocardiales bacterium]|nr:hypothetical protein [Pseudonocardiales bacterium]